MLDVLGKKEMDFERGDMIKENHFIFQASHGQPGGLVGHRVMKAQLLELGTFL